MCYYIKCYSEWHDNWVIYAVKLTLSDVMNKRWEIKTLLAMIPSRPCLLAGSADGRLFKKLLRKCAMFFSNDSIFLLVCSASTAQQHIGQFIIWRPLEKISCNTLLWAIDQQQNKTSTLDIRTWHIYLAKPNVTITTPSRCNLSLNSKYWPWLAT